MIIDNEIAMKKMQWNIDNIVIFTIKCLEMNQILVYINSHMKLTCRETNKPNKAK